jgi:molybdopterin-guanine dinucleotide biosynthesis protein A
MCQFPNITLAILAGGKASRMGGVNKALLEFNGQSFINLIHQSLSPLFQNSIIISSNHQNFNIPNAHVFPDLIETIGPLGGIHSALINTTNPYVFIVSCDMPFVDPNIAKILVYEFLITKPDILIPRLNSYNEPLFAIYSKRLVEIIDSIASSSNGKPIADLLKLANTNYYDLHMTPEVIKCFRNINSPDDLNHMH